VPRVASVPCWPASNIQTPPEKLRVKAKHEAWLNKMFAGLELPEHEEQQRPLGHMRPVWADG
jgi:hypothetical protein